VTDVLLINPSYEPSYGGARGGIVNPIHPTLGLATIAATARQRGHRVQILDLSWRPYDIELVRSKILEAKPDIVGITATTPLMNQLRDMSVLIKDISKGIYLVGGGAHPSALPTETLNESMLDAVFVGEADYSFADICDGNDAKTVKGIYYRANGEVSSTPPRVPIDNLDDLPMPAWDLYNLADYRRISRLLCRRPPITMAEFSRGCVFKCDFCASKITMALGYRKKSPERCAEEVRQMHTLGFREFMLADDIFTSDENWAVDVCEAISRTGIDMAWTCSNGIRVESAKKNLFDALRKAGCYRVSFGFESGNDQVLKLFGKGGRATIEQGKAAVRTARKAGIDVTGFFMLGLSPDSEKTMMDTIDFARRLPVDMMKFGISIAFPGTAMFNNYVKQGLVRSFDWDEYFIYTSQPLFNHAKLSYETIKRYMELAHRQAIFFNPSFLLRRFWRGIRTGEFFWDAYYALKYFSKPTISTQVGTAYYARDRWPRHSFSTSPPTPANYQVVRRHTQVTPSAKAALRNSLAGN
jgi:anaerobic magnesium-protoporphyrin IX monomethyl ester cyclase